MRPERSAGKKTLISLTAAVTNYICSSAEATLMRVSMSTGRPLRLRREEPNQEIFPVEGVWV